jgi:hypothetical protein
LVWRLRARQSASDLRVASWAAIALVVLICAGCGHTVTDQDCKQIGDNMLAIWKAEAAKAAASAAPPGAPSPTAEKAQAVVATEGDKLVTEWSAQCKKELSGRRVDQKEMDCLLKATSVAEMSKCTDL